MAGAIQEHVQLAEAVLRGLKDKNLRLEVELSNHQLVILRDKVVGDWHDHGQEFEKSLEASKIG